MILFMCHHCFSRLVSTRHVTQSHHKWSYAMNSLLPAQPALNPRKAMSSAPLLRLNPSVQQWLSLILYFHSSPLCFVTLSCLNCFLSAMKKQPKKASQDRKGLFWLSVSEGFSTSWWGGHSSRLGKRDTRDRGGSWPQCIWTQETDNGHCSVSFLYLYNPSSQSRKGATHSGQVSLP